MFIQRRIDTRSAPLDENFVREDTGPIRQIHTGNQTVAVEDLIGIIRNDWGAGVEGSYSSSVIITNATDADIALRWDASDHGRWEYLAAEMMVIGAPDFVHYGQAQRIMNTGPIGMPDTLTFALAPANISRPAAYASLYTILDASLENRIQTRVQDETQKIKEDYEEQLAIQELEIRALSNELSQIKENNQQQNHESEQIKNLYREEITKIPEVEKSRYKQRKNSIEFLVVVNQIRGGISRQLSQIETRLCNEYANWFFEFEHVGSRIFSQQSREGYTNLFSRD